MSPSAELHPLLDQLSDSDRIASARDEADRSASERWMIRCLELAGKGAGYVSPNPLVGAVVVSSEGEVLGEGWHALYGASHAEVVAIEEAKRHAPKENLKGSTLYVNLEPCSHKGKTPPCTDLIRQERLSRVVVGMQDPYPEVNGNGLNRLREAGIEVELGVLESVCRRFNEAYLHHLDTDRPLVTLKVAETLDGRIATPMGDSRWISGEDSRTVVHRMRSHADAVLVGTGTAQEDNPRLTVRHVEGAQPARIVLDRQGRLDEDLNLFTDEHASKTIVVTAPGNKPAYADQLRQAGGRVWTIPVDNGMLCLDTLLDHLGTEGWIGDHPVQSVLVEGGSGLSSSLLQQDLVDRLYVFVAPRVLGGGLAWFTGRTPEHMDESITFEEVDWCQCGDDMLFRGFLRPV